MAKTLTPVEMAIPGKKMCNILLGKTTARSFIAGLACVSPPTVTNMPLSTFHFHTFPSPYLASRASPIEALSLGIVEVEGGL